MVLTINQGDSVPFVETVTGINSLVNYAARIAGWDGKAVEE